MKQINQIQNYYEKLYNSQKKMLTYQISRYFYWILRSFQVFVLHFTDQMIILLGHDYTIIVNNIFEIFNEKKNFF